MVRSAARFKRSACIAFWFRDGRLSCTNYLTGVSVVGDAPLAAVLSGLDRWRTADQIIRLLPGFQARSVRRALQSLVRHGLVVRRGSDRARQESALAFWRRWGEEAALFHFVTKHAHCAAPVTDDERFTRALLRSSPPPSGVKRYRHARRVALPQLDPRTEEQFPRVLLARRTVREFGRTRIRLEDLGALLRLTWGVTGTIHWPGLGRVPVKTSPSGGARHPLEVYVFAQRVSGLAPGLYHYRPDTHQLEGLGPGARPAQIVRRCAGQPWIARCAALCVMTAVFPRVMWRYRQSRAYRVVLLEAGHFGQTFCLVATWLGLAPFSTAALLDEDLERDLGIDGVRESVIYAVGVGSTSSNQRRQ